MTKFLGNPVSKILSGAPLIAMGSALVPTIAMAQAGSVTDATDAAPQSPANQGEAAAGADADSGTGDIVVTATRRAQRLKDVPISVTSLSAEDMATSGVKTTSDLALVTPGLRMQAAANYVQPVIRGISTTTLNPSADNNVAIYIDGIYQQFPIGAVFEMPDVNQVQVLKGPQGTLFGRNATGGAILVSSRDPEFRTAGNMSVSYGRFNDIIGTAFLTAPIAADTLSFSIAGLAESRDGFNRNVATGKREGGLKNKLVRAKLRYAPTDGLDFVLTGLVGRRTDRDALRNGNLDGNNAYRGIVADSDISVLPYQFSVEPQLDPVVDGKYSSVSLRVSADIGPGKLTSTTGYVRNRTYLLYDIDNTAQAISSMEQRIKSTTYSQELVYSFSNLGNISGSIGAFYYNNTAGYDPLEIDGDGVVLYTKDKTEAYAGFGEFTYNLNDVLFLTGGLRYSHEAKTSHAAITFGDPTRLTSIPRLGEKSFNALNPRISLLYKISPATNIYATFSTGFKSGAFNSVSLQPEPVRPEKVTSYEVGMKTSIGGLYLATSGFYYDYKDLQSETLMTQPNGAYVSILANAATVRIYGAEIEGSWKPSSNLKFNFGATYLHPKYRSFENASVNVPVGLNGCDFRSGTSAQSGNVQTLCDVSGNQLMRAPKLSANLTSTYTVPVGSGAITASGNIYYSSKVFYDTLNRVEQAGYATIGSQLTWMPDMDQGISFSAFVRNITNRQIKSSVVEVTAFDQVSYELPRTYGVKVNYNF